MKVRLAQLAHARSGDKGDRADIGLFAWDAAGYAVLERCVTVERVAVHFAHLAPQDQARSGSPLRVERFALPNLLALKFVLDGALDGGAARSLRSDNLGKTIGALMLRMKVEISDGEGAALRYDVDEPSS